MIAAIVAVDENFGIGYQNSLLASIPEDLKHFKELTINNIIIMGRNTWESLPKKPLPDRCNIIISRELEVEDPLVWVMHIDEIKNLLTYAKDNFFIIGGAQLYKELLPYCEKVYLTKIYKAYSNVDAYFPNLDLSDEWAPISSSEKHTYKDIEYQFWEYGRR